MRGRGASRKPFALRFSYSFLDWHERCGALHASPQRQPLDTMRVLHVLHTSLPYLCGYSIRSDYIFRFQAQQGMSPAVVTSAQHPNGEAMHEEIHEVPHWRTPALAGKQLPLLRE